MIITTAIYQAWQADGPTEVFRHEMSVEINEILPEVGDTIAFSSVFYTVTKRIFDYTEEKAYIKLKRE